MNRLLFLSAFTLLFVNGVGAFSSSKLRWMRSISSSSSVTFLHPSLPTSFSSSALFAASGGGFRTGGGGSTKIDKRTAQTTSTKPSLKDEIEKDWRLIVHDDTIHTIQQVCEIISSCCPLCSGPRAYEVTLETHMTGAGTVAVANKKIISEVSFPFLLTLLPSLLFKTNVSLVLVL